MRAVVGWVVAAVMLVLVVLSAGENRRLDAMHERRADSLARVAEAAKAAHEITKARNAEREIGDQKHADSLRRMIARARARFVVDTLVDTLVMVPPGIAQRYDDAFVRDTLLPMCEECAARLDSAVLAARAEREAATLLHDSQRKTLDWWVAHDKPHHSIRTKLQERISVGCGYGVTKVGNEVLAGPQCGVALRLWP